MGGRVLLLIAVMAVALKFSVADVTEALEEL